MYFPRGVPSSFRLTLGLWWLTVLSTLALCPSEGFGSGCPNGKCCAGGACAYSGTTAGNSTYLNVPPPAPAAAAVGGVLTTGKTTSVPPASSGIWPFSTGMMGGSFGPRRGTQGPAPTQAQRPHPAVARIVATDRDAMSLGSGTLIYATDKHGLVITNWHVVRDAVGPIEVIFPDGFRSAGTVIKMDNNYDLAAIGIWRPRAEPVRLAAAAPLPGEPLTIAGYGGGSYRAATGRRSGRVYSPGGSNPAEWMEIVGAQARQGDSGGPIFNQQGELAGVLFGAAEGQTIGSYCGRVGTFLADVTPVLDRERSSSQEMLVDQRPTRGVNGALAAGETWLGADPVAAESASPRPISGARQEPAPALADNWRASGADATGTSRRNELLDAVAADSSGSPGSPPPNRSRGWPGPAQPPLASAQLSDASAQELRWEDFVGTTRGERAKSLLAAIGAVSILLFASRVMLAGSAE